MLKTFSTTLFASAEKTMKCDNCAKIILPSEKYVEEIVETDCSKYHIYDALATIYVSTFKPGKHISNNVISTFGDITLCSNCGIRMTNFYRAFKQFVGLSKINSKVSQYMKCLMRGRVPYNGKYVGITKNNTGHNLVVKVEEPLRINTPDPLRPIIGAHEKNPLDFMDFEMKEERPESPSDFDDEMLQSVNTQSPQTESSFGKLPETNPVESETWRDLERNTTPMNEPGTSKSTNTVDPHISDEYNQDEPENDQFFETNDDDDSVEEVSTILSIPNPVPSFDGKLHFVCPMCGERQKCSYTLQKHMTTLHKIPRKDADLHCKELQRMRKEAKVQAIGKLAGQEIPCDLCKQTFICVEMLEMHKLAAHPGEGKVAKPRTCTECGKTFSSQWQMKHHVYATHLKLKAFQCTQCDMGFTSGQSLRVHEATHTGEKILCSVCGKAFSHIKKLKEHEKQKHSNIQREIKFVGCNQCGKQVRSTYLRLHKLTHTDKRDYVCELCGKGFNVKQNLKSHLAYHRDVETRPNKCIYCGLGFPTKHSLKSHLVSGAHNLSLEQARVDAGLSSSMITTSWISF